MLLFVIVYRLHIIYITLYHMKILFAITLRRYAMFYFKLFLNFICFAFEIRDIHQL